MNGKREPRQEKTRLAVLEFLSRAVDALEIPMRDAERWVLPPDVSWFVDGVEKRVRALSKFFDEYLAKHPDAIWQGDPGHEDFVERELAYVRKSLGFIARIGKTAAETHPGKSTSATAREKNKRAVARQDSAIDFAAETEELRKLRSGELKIDPPPDVKGLQP